MEKLHTEHTPRNPIPWDDLMKAHRALLSLKIKSEKASDKLKEGSWQKKKMIICTKSADMAVRLIDGETVPPTGREMLRGADECLKDALRRADDTIGKFATGSSQHTLQKNRIAALEVALTLIEIQMEALSSL